MASYERALGLDPRHAEAHINQRRCVGGPRPLRGGDQELRPGALRRAGPCRRALQPREGAQRAPSLRGGAGEPGARAGRQARPCRGAVHPRQHFFALQRFEEAIACCQRVMAIDPDHRHAAAGLANCYLGICDWDRLARIEPRLKEGIAPGRRSFRPTFCWAFPSGRRSSCLHEELRCARVAPGAPAASTERAVSPERSGSLIFSSDFRRHATAYLAAGLFERHDREQFEVIGVSSGLDDKSDMRARLVRAFDRFHDVRARATATSPRSLRDLDVDIVIDLTGSYGDAGPSILAIVRRRFR